MKHQFGSSWSGHGSGRLRGFFKSRCIAVCGSEDLWKALVAQSIKTFSGLSFGCGTPQSPPSDDDFRAFAERVCGASVSIGDGMKL